MDKEPIYKSWQFLLGLFSIITIGYNIYDNPDDENAKEKPFKVVVLSEKTLCTNAGTCVQYVYFKHNSHKHKISLGGKGAYKIGDTAQLIKVYEDKLFFPIGRHGHNRDDPYHYEIYK